MSGNQVGYFYEPAERGRLCVIRFMAPHYTGGGEVVARNVELELAKTMCAALNSYASSQAEIERLTKALEPFDRAASALFTRNYNNRDVVVALPVDDSHPNQIKLTAADFFAVRAALSGSKE